MLYEFKRTKYWSDSENTLDENKRGAYCRHGQGQIVGERFRLEKRWQLRLLGQEVNMHPIFQLVISLEGNWVAQIPQHHWCLQSVKPGKPVPTFSLLWR